MQRQLSSFDIYVIVSELQKLIGCQVDKIYQISQNEILIRVKNIENKENVIDFDFLVVIFSITA